MTEFDVIDWGCRSYLEGYAGQKELLKARLCGEAGDTLVLVEHAPVFTIGRQGSRDNILVGPEFLKEKGIEVLEIERGGDITYHGPGQLVAYPIFHLAEGRRDVKRFFRELERVIIRTCRRFAVPAVTIEGLTGVWIGNDSTSGTHIAAWQTERKIASIGLAFKKWTSYHGIALNVCGDLAPFTYMHLCGLKGKQAISLSEAAGKKITIEQVKPVFIEEMRTMWNGLCEARYDQKN
jgi:lipoate-protein ligase B